MKHLKVTFLSGFTKYYPCDNFVLVRSLNLLFVYLNQTASGPSETINFGNVIDYKIVMLQYNGAPDVPRNPLCEDANYDNPLN